MAAADATRIEGILPPSVDPAKRVLVQRVPQGRRRRHHALELAVHDARGAHRAGPRRGQHRRLEPGAAHLACSVALAECIVDAGLPPGVFNLVTGPGTRSATSWRAIPRVAAIGFIGSTRPARRIAERAAGKELLLEMGGNGPLVILDDADLDAAVDATLTACFLNAGQSCTAGERVLVAARVHDESRALHAAVESGSASATRSTAATTMGPLNNEAAAAKTEHHVTTPSSAARPSSPAATRAPATAARSSTQPTSSTA